MKEKSIDIILPCFNPIKGWEQQVFLSLQNLQTLMPSFQFNIILVNDGSTKGISEFEINFLKQNIPNFEFINLNENQGKGAALKKGFELSKNEYSIFTDIDFPYLESNIEAMVQKLEQNADIVIGIRNKTYYSKVPPLRSLLSSSFKKLLKILFKIPVTDTQAGLKAFSKKGKEILLQTETNRYLFDLELIKRSAKADLNFEYTDLTLKDNVVLSKISLKILWSEILNLIKIFLL